MRVTRLTDSLLAVPFRMGKGHTDQSPNSPGAGIYSILDINSGGAFPHARKTKVPQMNTIRFRLTRLGFALNGMYYPSA